jgi:hypothetical protein
MLIAKQCTETYSARCHLTEHNWKSIFLCPTMNARPSHMVLWLADHMHLNMQLMELAVVAYRDSTALAS